MKKCPPGVICVENYAAFFLLVVTLLFGLMVWSSVSSGASSSSSSGKNQTHNINRVVIHQDTRTNTTGGRGWLGRWAPSWPYTNADPLLDPYSPPLRDERYFVATAGPALPINVSTNVGAVDTAYRQVGMLTATNTKERILPLMGRPLFVNRDKWQYYTMSDQNNSIKLPVSRSGRSCTNEYGCTQLYTGDTVYVNGINEAFRVTLYDNDTIRYLPYF